MVFRLQPFDVGRQSAQAREERKLIYALFVERPLQSRVQALWNNDIIHRLGLKRLVRFRMNGEESSLGRDARRDVFG